MVVLGLGFLVLLSGIAYLGTERAKLDTTMPTVPVSEQLQNQESLPIVVTEVTTTDETEAALPPLLEAEVDESVSLPQAKIDVRVACESALMYTTFTDGASAEAFVADCIAGKHPEVIERFISELGVDSAAI